MALVPSLDGRMEKRIPIAIVVYLARAQEQPANAAELTYTDNISTHGACVISSRAWERGEMVAVTSLQDKVSLRGKVIHCEKRSNEHYAVGLAFQGDHVTWMKYRNFAGS